jgi:hypothetical protein
MSYLFVGPGDPRLLRKVRDDGSVVDVLGRKNGDASLAHIDAIRFRSAPDAALESGTLFSFDDARRLAGLVDFDTGLTILLAWNGDGSAAVTLRAADGTNVAVQLPRPDQADKAGSEKVAESMSSVKERQTQQQSGVPVIERVPVTVLADSCTRPDRVWIEYGTSSPNFLLLGEPVKASGFYVYTASIDVPTDYVPVYDKCVLGEALTEAIHDYVCPLNMWAAKALICYLATLPAEGVPGLDLLHPLLAAMCKEGVGRLLDELCAMVSDCEQLVSVEGDRPAAIYVEARAVWSFTGSCGYVMSAREPVSLTSSLRDVELHVRCNETCLTMRKATYDMGLNVTCGVVESRVPAGSWWPPPDCSSSGADCGHPSTTGYMSGSAIGPISSGDSKWVFKTQAAVDTVDVGPPCCFVFHAAARCYPVVRVRPGDILHVTFEAAEPPRDSGFGSWALYGLGLLDTAGTPPWPPGPQMFGPFESQQDVDLSISCRTWVGGRDEPQHREFDVTWTIEVVPASP